jgi:glycosyltransferase involved in cell wall biosynthesis
MMHMPKRTLAGAPVAAPWVLVSAGFHEQGGQSKANAALADFLLGRGTPVHLVGHDFAPRFRQQRHCTIYTVPRPAGADLLGVWQLRRRGRAVARQVCAQVPAARVMVNGGCCSWDDMNWLHFVHSAWRPSLGALPPLRRLKEASAAALFRSQEREALGRARLVIADSEQTRQLAIDHLRLDPTKVQTIYYGSEPSWRPPEPAQRAAARAWLGVPPGRPLAVFVGGFGFDERKGFDTLWQAWQELCRDRNWDLDLIAAGGGRALGRWQECVRQAGLAQRVRLMGFTDRVFDLLAAADLLISPVRYEPYGLNVQEAICRGVPALVSAQAGITEQFPAELAGLVLPDPNDVRDLVGRLRAWRTEWAAWRQRVQPFSQRLRERSWARMAADIVALAEDNEQSAFAAAPRRRACAER